MKTNCLPYFLLLMVMLLSTASLRAQLGPLEASRPVAVKLRGSVEYIGLYQGEKDGYYILKEEGAGEVQLAKGMVQSIEMIPPARFFNGEYWQEPRGVFQNLLTPTGFNPRPGELHYKNVSLLFNQLTAGINSRVSIGVLFTGWTGLGVLYPVYGIMPKVSLTPPGYPAQIAAGALLVSVPDDKHTVVDAALLYSAFTYGTPDRNFSFGLGYGFIDRRWASQPAYTLSTHYRVGRSLALIAEGWAIPPLEATVGTLGFKIIGRRADWSFSFPAGIVERQFFFIPLPLVSFSTALYRF